MPTTLLVILLLRTASALGSEFTTNSVQVSNAPSWLKASRVDRVVEKAENFLQWDTRRVRVYWYTDAASFEKVHKLGPAVQAFSRRDENAIHVGPAVDSANFDQVFGHEVAHIIQF